MDSRGTLADHGGVVLVPLHCRGCGYNLYGLPSGDRCPECGLEAWQSILHTVDPAASRLPVLQHPGAVGDALLWLIACMAGTALFPALGPAARWLDAMDESGLRHFSAWVPAYLDAVAGVIALGGLFWVRRLAPPTGLNGARAGRDLVLLAAGLATWGMLLIVASVVDHAVSPWASGAVRVGAAAGCAAALLGLSGILKLIGLRSREYRTARGSRQGIQAMVAAVGAIAAGEALRAAALSFGNPRLGLLASSTTSIATVMVVIGLLYLLVNAWWIRSALRRPPPRLDQILGTAPT